MAVNLTIEGAEALPCRKCNALPGQECVTTGAARVVRSPHRQRWDDLRQQRSPPSIVAAQPAPAPNANPAVWGLVMADMQARDQFGAAKYGVRLQPHNGRDYLLDAYQEALDLVVYLRGAMYERDGK